MKILLVTIAWPEKGGRNIYTDLIGEFHKRGHDITVVASRPRKRGLPSAKSNEHGIRVVRVKTGNVTKTGPIEKMIALLFLGRQLNKGIQSYLKDENFDLILFNTPPITLSGFLKKLKKRYQCPLYLLLKDIWPYGFADNGLIKENGWIYNYFKKHEKRIYDLADYIGCMSPAGVEFVLNQYPELDSNKVEVCPNSIRIQNAGKDRDLGIRQKYGIPERATVFIFSGNLGIGQGLDFLMQAILKLKNYDKAFFIIGGSGTYFENVKHFFEEHTPKNAYFYSYLPDEEYEALISNCDVGMILLDHRYSYPQFPSRLLSYLENKMAVLCSVNKETDIGEIVEENGVGLNILHGDMENFTKAVQYLSENKSKIMKMGDNGFKLLKRKYDSEISYHVINKHFDRS